MYGRYGMDSYGRFLLVVSAVCLLIGSLTANILSEINLCSLVGVLILIYGYFRMLSKNLQRRAQENYVYYGAKNEFTRIIQKLIKKFSYNKTHKVFKCPKCKQQLRVPRGRGKICITCSKCKHEFIKKS